jgi:FAD/FMN-containing dehydrogenase
MSTKLAVSRRSLLAGVAASAILPWRPSRAARPEPDWDELAKLIGSPVLLPNDPRFVRLTQPENLHYYRSAGTPGAPMAVVRPSTAQAIATAVKWAADQKIPVVARSGGHSYAGCSTIPGLIINTACLRRVDYDSSSNLLKIEGGALNGNILKALKDLKPAGFENGMAIVHGRCPAVGVSAYLMGGGIGFNMNSFGAGCDRVDKVEVALADGRVVTASEDNTDKDLFWAVRGGGGGNLGIATCWWLRPFPVNQAAGFVASWQAGNDPGALQAPFTTIVRVLENSPPELGAQVSLSASKGKPWPTSIRLVGQFLGTWDEFKRRCPGLLEGAAQCAHVEGAYWKIQEFLDVEAIPNRYLETSLFTGPLTDDAIGTLFKKFGTWPGTTSAARITFFRTGGEMNKVKKPGETAFVHRRSEWLADTDIDWDDRDTDQDVYNSLRWQRDVHAELDQAFAGQGSYQNFPDPGLANHGIAYWGANLKRLVEVKLQYDPTFVFTPPQNQEIAG